jgi:ribose transport system substrate-binding protein
MITKAWRTCVALAAMFAAMAAPAAAQDEPVIGYAVMGYDHPLFQAMKRGAEQTAQDLEVNLRAVDGKFDVNRQNSQIENFISQGVDALLVNPVTAKETVPSLEKAKAAGIPVIAIDTRPVGFQPDAFVTMNHYQGGYTIGWRIASDLRCEGRYAVIWAVGNEQAASRVRGFRAGMREFCQVTGQPFNLEEEGDYSGITGPLRDTARKITDTLLTKYSEGELSFVFGQTDEWANGAYLATKAANRPDVKVYGMDNNDDARAFIAENGNLVATTAHLPVEVGTAAVQVAKDIIDGKPHLPEIQLNFRIVDQENVADDPGWTGSYQPTFSDFATPQQLSALSESVQEAATTAPASAPTGADEGSGANPVLIAIIVALALALVATLVLSRRRQAPGRPLGPPVR